MTKKIEMSKSEAKEAGKLNTEKFHELRQFMAAYPGYEVQIKAPGRHKVELRGLDYKYMREYIQKHDDEQHSKMEKFKTLIAQDKKDGKEDTEHLEAAGYLDVRAWFLATFLFWYDGRSHACQTEKHPCFECCGLFPRGNQN